MQPILTNQVLFTDYFSKKEKDMKLSLKYLELLRTNDSKPN